MRIRHIILLAAIVASCGSDNSSDPLPVLNDQMGTTTQIAATENQFASLDGNQNAFYTDFGTDGFGFPANLFELPFDGAQYAQTPITTILPVGTNNAVRVSRSGQVFVTATDEVYILEPDGSKVPIGTSMAWDDPYLIAVDDETGLVYVEEGSSSTIYEIDVSDASPSTAVATVGGLGIASFAVQSGILYLCCEEPEEPGSEPAESPEDTSSEVGVLGPDQPIWSLDLTANQFMPVQVGEIPGCTSGQIAVDAAGNVYATDANFVTNPVGCPTDTPTVTVYEFEKTPTGWDPASILISTDLSCASFPTSLAVDEEGENFVLTNGRCHDPDVDGGVYWLEP